MCGYRAASGLIDKLRRQLVELRQQLRRQRQAVGQRGRRSACARSSPGSRTRLARQRLGGAQLADVAVDLRLETFELLEARRIERQHELPGIVDLLRLGVEVDAIAAEEARR